MNMADRPAGHHRSGSIAARAAPCPQRMGTGHGDRPHPVPGRGAADGRGYVLLLGFALTLGLFALGVRAWTRGRLGWMTPAVARSAEDGRRDRDRLAGGLPHGAAVFALLAASVWHYDAIYRIRNRVRFPDGWRGCFCWVPRACPGRDRPRSGLWDRGMGLVCAVRGRCCHHRFGLELAARLIVTGQAPARR